LRVSSVFSPPQLAGSVLILAPYWLLLLNDSEVLSGADNLVQLI
jgi:hypothetical protein